MLHIGTNGVNTPGSEATDVDGLLDEVNRYETDYNPVKVILARIINAVTANPDITDFNDAVELIAQTRIDSGDDIVIVDMEDGALIDYNTSTDMIDNDHPSDTGYEKMANLWYSALSSTLPIHHWDLDETTGTGPYVSYLNTDGTCAAGECPSPVTGQINGAQQFDGTKKVDVINTTNFDWGRDSSYTIEFWMKTNTSSSGTQNNVMMGRESGSTAGALAGLAWFVGIDKNSGQIIYGQSDNAGENITYLENAGPLLATDTWHHIAIVRDGTAEETILYIDGVSEHNQSIIYTAGADFTESTPVNIGHFKWGATNYLYDGTLDEIALYNSALSEDEIKRHYNNVFSFEITTDPVTWAIVGEQYSYDVNTNSNDPVTYSFGVSPSGMSIDGSGLINWTPTVPQAGNNDVTVLASNGVNPDASQSYTIATFDFSQFPTSMEGYWRLNEANGPSYVDSVGTANGNCTGTCPVAAVGQVAGAQQFDGTVSSAKIDVDVTTNFNWGRDDSYSIEFWMNTGTRSSGSQNNVMMGRESGSTSGPLAGLAWFVGIHKTNGQILYGQSDNAGENITYFENVGLSLDTNTWHHIVIVRDGTTETTKLYIDNELVHNVPIPYTAGADFTESTPVNFGHFKWGGDSFLFDGTLDEIALYNSALSIDEIAAHHQNGLNKKGFGGAGAADAAKSTVTATTNNAAADRTATDVLEATILDANSNPVSGETVTFAKTTQVTFSTLECTTDATGKCSITATSSKAGNYSTAVTIGAETLSDSPVAYAFTGAADAGTSAVGVSDTTIAADGSETSTVTVTVKDANSNPVTSAAVSLAQGTGASTISAVNPVGDGTYTFTVSSTTAETVTYTATADTVAITQTAAVTFTVGAADAGTSAVGVSDTTIAADGSETSTVTVTVKDANSNPVTSAAVSLAQGTGASTISAVNPVGDGTYTFTVSSTTAETVTYTATADTVAITQTAAVTFTVGAADAGTSAVGVSDTTIAADGSETSTVTVTVKDANSNPVTSAAVSLAQGTGASTISAVNPVGDGTYTFTVSSTTAETVTYTATADAVTLTQIVDITFTTTTPPPDTTPPTLAEVTAVPTPTNDTTPSYTFSSDEAGSITYGGSCSSATADAIAGNNTITFNTLAEGTYSNCTITVTDASNNISTALTVTEFIVDTTVPDTTPPTLAEVTPVPTPTNDATPNYTFSSDEAGTIAYGGSCSSAAKAATVGNNTITFDALVDGTYSDCTITVTDASNNISTALTVTEFVVDTTVPWYEPNPDGSYTSASGGSTIKLNYDLFTIIPSDDNIIFKQTSESNIGGCVINAYIELMSNGDVIAGYKNSCADDTNEYAPGATVSTVSVDDEMVLLIEAEVPEDGITLGGI